MTKYYNTSDATFNHDYLQLCGDVSPNPGPTAAGDSSDPRCNAARPNRISKLSCLSLNARSIVNKERELRELEKSLALVERNGSNLTTVLLGDFNFPGIDWTLPSPSCSDSLSSYFCDIFDDYFLCQMVNQATRGDNLLDLVFINKPDLLSDLTICDGLGHSDHNSIEFTLKVKISRPRNNPRLVYDFKHADWDGLKEDLVNIPWNCMDLVDDIDVIWNSWKSLFLEAVDRNIPSKSISSKRHVPWLNSSLRKLIHKKRRLWKKAKSSGDTNHWSAYKRFNNKVKDSLRKAYHSYDNQLTESLSSNPKKFWSFVKSRTGTSSVPSCIEYNGIKAYCPADKAEIFNKFFHSVFSRPVDEFSPPSNMSSSHVISDLICTEDDVAKVLAELETNKSHGPDNIPPRILKVCAKELAPSLAKLFNISLSSGNLPSEWKVANVVPIHKSRDRVLATNYRPVSLTSIVVRSLERLIHKHIMVFLTDQSLLCDNQHGFRKYHSCLTQLLQLLHHWFSTLDKHGAVDVMFLDFSKAFDKVSHQHLFLKLNTYGIKGQLLSWIRNLLVGRKQRVVIEGHASNWLEVTSGVPQGSILGPLLFLIYINDIPSSVSSCNVDLFADDSVLHRQVSSFEDCQLFQNDLVSVRQWCDATQIQLNEKEMSCTSCYKTKTSSQSRL